MLKVAVHRLLPGVPHVPLLYPNLGHRARGANLFLSAALSKLAEPLVEVVEDPARADLLLVPHNWPAIRREETYIREFADVSRRHGKRIVVFWHGDGDAAVPLENAVIFRTSQYRASMRPNEIVMPAYVEDLLGDRPLAPRTKPDPPLSASPMIGFCGWAGYKNLKNRVGTLARNALIEVRARLTGNVALRARIKGITFRMRAIEELRGSPLVRTNFLLRRSYSGHRDTIGLDPGRAREEFVANILDSDFALVVKGDGNYSYRFYEALSLGRVPLLLDTDCVLPLEDMIPYQDFVCFVDWEDLPRIAQIAREFYDELTAEQWDAMQRQAREAFEKHLSVPAFLRHAVEHLIPG